MAPPWTAWISVLCISVFLGSAPVSQRIGMESARLNRGHLPNYGRRVPIFRGRLPSALGPRPNRPAGRPRRRLISESALARRVSAVPGNLAPRLAGLATNLGRTGRKDRAASPMRASCRTRLARRMADRESLLTHWIQSPVRAAGLGTQRDFGCRLLAVGHGCAGASAGAVHKAESRASGLATGRPDRFLAGHPDVTAPFLDGRSRCRTPPVRQLDHGPAHQIGFEFRCG
jgi:hypothetical protein